VSSAARIVTRFVPQPVTFALIGRALAAGPALSIVPVPETLQGAGRLGWPGDRR